MPLARTPATSEVTAKGRSNGYTARLEWPPSLRQVHSELPCSMMATKRFETGQELDGGLRIKKNVLENPLDVSLEVKTCSFGAAEFNGGN